MPLPYRRTGNCTLLAQLGKLSRQPRPPFSKGPFLIGCAFMASALLLAGVSSIALPLLGLHALSSNPGGTLSPWTVIGTVGVMLLLSGLAMASVIWSIRRRRQFERMARSGLICWRCMHSLRGLPDDAAHCPECGFSVKNTKSLLQQYFRMPEPWMDGAAEE